MDIRPTFELQPSILLAGCPQFGDTGKVCPGAAWERLFAMRLQAGLPKVSPVGYGVLVLPPEFPGNDHQHYYFAAFEACPLGSVQCALPWRGDSAARVQHLNADEGQKPTEHVGPLQPRPKYAGAHIEP